jgi:radical SAM superfamily enzyme YgiQ (UPF0313 family)
MSADLKWRRSRRYARPPGSVWLRKGFRAVVHALCEDLLAGTDGHWSDVCRVPPTVLDAMLAAGFLAEVPRLFTRSGLNPDLPALRSVGYRQAWDHLAGRGSFEEFRSAAVPPRAAWPSGRRPGCARRRMPRSSIRKQAPPSPGSPRCCNGLYAKSQALRVTVKFQRADLGLELECRRGAYEAPPARERTMPAATAEPRRRFELILIKPSHYDDDGYVIQWARSSIPSNSLAALYGLALDCAQRQVLGPQVEIVITAWDETNTRTRAADIVARLRAAGGSGLVALVGVQSNQFPRAVDIARPLRVAGIPVCIGGFHVSGCLAMLPELPADLKAAQALGITLFAGEAEGRLEALLQAADAGALAPLYNYMDDLPGLEGAPPPYLPARTVRRTSGVRTSLDAGRGCPFLCSFCTIINVQGRKSRTRSADDVEQIVRANLAQGVHNFFITDDNLARNQNWEAIFDRLIAMREQEGLRLSIVAQVDTMAHKIRGFIDKAGRAGVNRVFIGLENINPDSLKGAQKGQNHISEYRAMLQAWHAVGALTYAGYILGFPGDTPESIARDIGIIQRELPVDILEFFLLTPLPGSADHKALHLAGTPMDADMNKYDLAHVTTAHATMSEAELLGIYHRAWDLYYSPAHVETVLRRAKTWGYDLHNMMWKLLSFHAPQKLEDVHPLDGGVFRRKYRRDRRPTLPLENPLLFHWRESWRMIVKHARFVALYWRYRRTWKRVARDRTPYCDLATAQTSAAEADVLELFNATRGAQAEAARARRRTIVVHAA